MRLRTQYQAATYHVFERGDHREDVFRELIVKRLKNRPGMVMSQAGPMRITYKGIGLGLKRHHRMEKKLFEIFAICAAVLAYVFPQSCSGLTNTWSGPTGGNWSDPGNWSQGTIPDSSDIVRFSQATVSAVVDSNFTHSIGGLKVEQISSDPQWLLLALATNRCLQVGGDMIFGASSAYDMHHLQPSVNSNAFFGTGGGLVLSNAFASNSLVIGNARYINQGLPIPVVLNLSELDNFTGYLGQIRIADGSFNTYSNAYSAGSLLLARTNVIIVSNLLVGVAQPTDYIYGSDFIGSGSLLLGETNIIFSDHVVIGGGLSTNRMLFQDKFTNSIAVFRGHDGVSPITQFSVCEAVNTLSTSPNESSQTVVDFSPGTVDMKVERLLIAQVDDKAFSAHVARGRLKMSKGLIEAQSVSVGVNVATNSSNSSIADGGIEIIGPGKMTVASSLQLGTNFNLRTFNGPVLATINLLGGTLAVSNLLGYYTNSAPPSNSVAMTNGVLIVSNFMGGGIRDFILDSSTLQIPGKSTASVVVSNLTTSGSSNLINIGAASFASYPTQVALIKYTGNIHGAGYNFVLGSLPNRNQFGFLSNNVAASRIDLVLDFAPILYGHWLNPGFALSITGMPNRKVEIQTSTNLHDWEILLSQTNASGSFSITNNSPNDPERFFRAREVP